MGFAFALLLPFLLITNASGAAPNYLDTSSYPSPGQSQLLAAAEGRGQPTAKELRSLTEAYESDPAYLKLVEAYQGGLYRYFKVNPEKPAAWKKKNAKLLKGIDNYVGSSDESMADEEISWQSINGKLRQKEKLTAAEQKYLDEIKASMALLPTVKGLAFRGQAMTPERFASIPEKAVWPQMAFTSATLSYSTARGFGRGHEGYSWTGILILKLKSGAPVSPLTFDGGSGGQPGRLDEYELLLAPGSKLFVHAKIKDEENQTYYVLAEER
ncbi:MAG: hypothetical protein EOP11_09275 [Proteobacteria bacterium]|nr:MAG: hypothetical protein EOP11_09275 [Pseudomonadota bacterium]